MGKKKDVHVVPHGDQWAVKKTGNERASSLHDRQSEAWASGKDAARKEKSEAILHGEDGRIRERDSYGNDPNPPRDKR